MMKGRRKQGHSGDHGAPNLGWKGVVREGSFQDVNSDRKPKVLRRRELAVQRGLTMLSPARGERWRH